MFSRAPSQALRANSASSATSATVSGFGFCCGSDLEVAVRERAARIRAGGNHREVARIVKFLVAVEREQADQNLAFLHDDGNRRRDEVGAIRPVDEIDFVDVEKLGVNAGYIRRIGLIIVIDELDLAAKQSALGVDFLLPDLGPQQRLLAVRRQRTGERQAEKPILMGCVALRRSRSRREPAGAATKAAPIAAMTTNYRVRR